jgi:hypothetical protein
MRKSIVTHSTRGFFILISILLASTSHASGETKQATAPDYTGYEQSYRLPYARAASGAAVDFNRLQSLGVRVSINGAPPIRLQIDTGSTGVVVGASDVPNIEPNSPPGSITYSSSGVQVRGVWTRATLTFVDAVNANGQAATAVVPILAVSARTVRPGAVNTAKDSTESNPKVYMLGIGNGRGTNSQQDKNPWVNLTEMQADTMRRGYTVTRDGVTLGLTAASVGSGFLYEQLMRRPGATKAPDWSSPRGRVTVGNVDSGEAEMLLDTGLTNMMIPAPRPDLQGDVTDDTLVKVELMGGRLTYQFRVGDRNDPAAPRRVTWVPPSARLLVNTGLRALARFDYLYDADGGVFGLRVVK